MERHTLRAVLGIGLLVVLAWIGIALFDKLHEGHAPIALLVIWGVAVLAVVFLVFRSVGNARQARIERRPEAEVRRK